MIMAEKALRVGVALFPGFQALDVFGPLDALNVLSWKHKTRLAMVAASLEPVSTKAPGLADSIEQRIVPTHTFASAPALDVLLVPGGLGSTSSADPADIEAVVSFIRTVYPSLQYLVTVCTGSGLAARAGVLDGKRATTNKRSWKSIVALGPHVQWVAHARWVVDGNVWTSSGVSAGMDLMFAWIEAVYGADVAQQIADAMEYGRQRDAGCDPFAVHYGL